MTDPREFVELPPMTRERIAAAIQSLIDVLDAIDFDAIDVDSEEEGDHAV